MAKANGKAWHGVWRAGEACRMALEQWARHQGRVRSCSMMIGRNQFLHICTFMARLESETDSQGTRISAQEAGRAGPSVYCIMCVSLLTTEGTSWDTKY